LNIRRFSGNFHWRSFLGALLFAALLTAIPASASAPQSGTGSIAGKLTVMTGNGATNSLSGITVKLTGTAEGSAPQTTITDPDGHYAFTRLAPGAYNLEATLEGFKPFSAMVTLGQGQAITQDVMLQLNAVNEQVEVHGEAAEISTQSVTATATVSEQQLETLPLRTGKFTEALSVSPSVIRTQEGTLNFNGQAESQGMLLVDSTENVDPVSGSFAVPVPVDAIQSIQVYNTQTAPNLADFPAV
jgi:hypothetical protein